MIKLWPILNDNPEPEYELMESNEDGIGVEAPIMLTSDEYQDFRLVVRAYIDWQDNIRLRMKDSSTSR